VVYSIHSYRELDSLSVDGVGVVLKDWCHALDCCLVDINGLGLPKVSKLAGDSASKSACQLEKSSLVVFLITLALLNCRYRLKEDGAFLG
jgi:hypothetical protein